MNTETITESWPGSLSDMGILSTFKEPSDTESHDEMMDIIKEVYAMEGDLFSDLKKPQQEKQKPFGDSDDDIMETWLHSTNDFHHTFPTQILPFTHILPMDDKEHVMNTHDVSIVKKKASRTLSSDLITDARNESAMNFLLNSCVEENAFGNFEGIQATDLCSLLEQFETASAQLGDESTNVTPSVSENVTPAVSANVSPCVSADVTPCVSADVTPCISLCVTPAMSAPPSPMIEVLDAEEDIIVNVVDIISDSDEIQPSEPETRKVPKLTLIKQEPNLIKPKPKRISKDQYLARMKNRPKPIQIKQEPLPTLPMKDPKLSLIKQENTPSVSPGKKKSVTGKGFISLCSEPETRNVPKLTLIKQGPNLVIKPKPNRISKDQYLARMKNRPKPIQIKQEPLPTLPMKDPKLSLIKQENTPSVSPVGTPPSTPPPEVIEKIKSSNKPKSAILLPMGMPSKRGRGQAMSMPVHCTTPKMQKLVKQNYGTPMQPSIPRPSSSTLQKNYEQSSETLAVLDHDYCFMSKSCENSRASSEVGSVLSASSVVKADNDDSNSHASDVHESHSNINLDSGSVLKALLISGNRENAQKARAEAAEQNVIKERNAQRDQWSIQNTNDCVDTVQINADEIENFEMAETKAVQSTHAKNTFKGKEHRKYRKKVYEQEGKTFDKLPGYFTTLSRPLKSTRQDILAVSATTEQQTIERDISPERQNSSAFSKLPAYHNCFTNSTKYDRGAYMLSASEEEAIRNAVLGERRRNNRRSRSSYSSRSASSSANSDTSRSPSRSRSRSNSRTRCRSRSGSRYGSKQGSRYGSRHGSRSRQASGSRSRLGSRSRHGSRSRLGSRSHSRAQSRSRMNRKPYNSRKYSNRRPRSRSRSWSRSRSRSRSYSRSRSRSRSLSSERGPCHRRRRSRSPSYELFRDDDKSQQIEERRIIYVGNIPAEYTRVDLEKRFGRFGEIEDISVHFREHGDNYGFVTFAYTCDAYAAKENGNKIPGVPKFDLCFGGRRQFCKSDYADLDGNIEIEEEYNVQPKKNESMDFDMLLKMAKQKLKR